MTENFRPTVIRNKTWEALRGKWGQSALMFLLYLIIVTAAVQVVGRIFPQPRPDLTQGFDLRMFIPAPSAFATSWVVNIFLLSMFGIGATFMWLDVSYGKSVELRTLFEAFRRYLHYLAGVLIVWVLVMLWLLLLIIPGIVKALAYGMTFFIMRENPDMSPNDARKLSIEMMRGHKWHLFLLYLSFIGWIILGLLSCGIGLLWIYPYVYTAVGEFYRQVKGEHHAA